jgi:hypothetical protein
MEEAMWLSRLTSEAVEAPLVVSSKPVDLLLGKGPFHSMALGIRGDPITL